MSAALICAWPSSGWAVLAAPPAAEKPPLLSPHLVSERPWLGAIDPAALRRTNPVPLNHDSIKRGRAVYNGLCVTCHGVNGDGESRTPIFRALRPKPLIRDGNPVLPDGAIVWVIENGVQGTAMKPMHAMLSEQERWHVTNYVHVMARPWLTDLPLDRVSSQLNPVPASTESVEQGRQAYANLCVACHGRSGRGDAVHPFFSGLHPKPLHVGGRVVLPDNIVAWVISYGLRGTFMKPMHSFMEEADTWHVVNYLHELARDASTGH